MLAISGPRALAAFPDRNKEWRRALGFQGGPSRDVERHRRDCAASLNLLQQSCPYDEGLSGSPQRFSTAPSTVFRLMAGRWHQAAEALSFRFFTPEEVDRILVEGARRGRAGSHAAIERILKHELQLGRPDLWQRIRQLKNTSLPTNHRRPIWRPEDEKILRDGYQNGWRGKREAVRELLRRHPDWRPHTVWRHAGKFGLVHREARCGQERTHQAWSEEDEEILMDLSGYKSARKIAKLLHRSEAAVRSHLSVLGKSSRVDLDGFSRHALATQLHLSSSTIQRWIVRGLLEVRDPRITRKSLDCLAGSGRPPTSLRIGGEPSGMLAVSVQPKENSGAGPSGALIPAEPATPSNPSSRAKRAWTEVANCLGVPLAAVEELIACGALKMYDPTIPEKSFRNFCRRYGSVINWDALDYETRDWLRSVMDFNPHAGESVAKRLKTLRKHAEIVRHCECGRTIRGNAFFRHRKRCSGMKSASETGP